MKAILFTGYGPPEVLQLREVETPAPKDNEVLVRVFASSVNAIEWRMFTLPRLFVRLLGGFREPKDKSIGGDFAGRVEAVGAAVKQFQTGDEVFGLRRGAFAEYVCAAEDRLARKPANVSFEAAAAVPLAALTALQALRDTGKIRRGQEVLIHGAGGGVGMFAVQLAKFFGAQVTAVCGAGNVEIARSSGADCVVDYTQEDITKSGKRYDLIVAVNGYPSISDYRRMLNPKGICVVVGGSGSLLRLFFVISLGPLISRLGKRKFGMMLTRPNRDDLVFLKDLVEAGKLVPVIDRCYPLPEVSEAIKYVLQGHPRGKVVITTTQSKAAAIG